jgi:Flp pilus assembly pilin Flp
MKLKQRNTKLSKTQVGAAIIEYAIMLGLISAISIPIISVLKTRVGATFGNISTQFSAQTQQQIQSTQQTSNSNNNGDRNDHNNDNGKGKDKGD